MTFKNNEIIWNEANQLLKQGKDDLAIKLFTNISNSGDWSGSYMLGYIYQERGMKQDSQSDICIATHKKSLKWFERSLTQHEQYLASYGIAKYYYYGLGGEINHKKALDYLLKSISSESFDENQVPLAYAMMGELLWHGKGCAKDLMKSKEFFYKAVSLEYPAGYVGLMRVAVYENKYLSVFALYIKGIILSLKLYFSDSNHPQLAGIGRKWGNVRLPKEV